MVKLSPQAGFEEAQDNTRPDMLHSWKEIALYLGRSSRTVQRWERTEALPVHRVLHDKRSSVYALKSELDAWWKERGRTELISRPSPDNRKSSWMVRLFTAVRSRLR